MIDLFAPWRRPSALVLASRALEDTLRQRLEMTAHREYYSAMEDMLTQRVDRLREDVAALSDAAEALPPHGHHVHVLTPAEAA